jgi:hypothetical protein
MTPEEYEVHMEKITRCRELVDDWAELKRLGKDAEKYC